MGFPQLWRVWAREAPCGPAHEVGLGFELLGYGGGGVWCGPGPGRDQWVLNWEDDVARAVRLGLVAGGPMRARVTEMKEVLSSKDWNQVDVDKFVHFLKKMYLLKGNEN